MKVLDAGQRDTGTGFQRWSNGDLAAVVGAAGGVGVSTVVGLLAPRPVSKYSEVV
ncbi:hypothetical protein ThrDRAFT_04597 [Frankia casuarinae]|uniref:hypothetical protein n=1 Tax=Frankia TaxID=1854 RepID=UPI00031654C9|nr:MULTISPECIES: hypothetical protein [Frankia]ETA03460.1 hypothetical protein CcI6DRAFT_01176 [Frankia sp. CcI6]EYT89772.1 hypothetical protein ThrDRAFT_04597 [Frankia casuarinae]KDA40980.1 hypothetical protein BMG523Draft_04224 [Frankia sp. BMG5.23]KEZ34500.1 hypothetical protein CEDDRAFT_04125 [Frankia sp. CeD]KFB03613.1 hypothetical protein ALLO2DRAFT_03655 [Frankia sp. Allo2]